MVNFVSLYAFQNLQQKKTAVSFAGIYVFCHCSFLMFSNDVLGFGLMYILFHKTDGLFFFAALYYSGYHQTNSKKNILNPERAIIFSISEKKTVLQGFTEKPSSLDYKTPDNYMITEFNYSRVFFSLEPIVSSFLQIMPYVKNKSSSLNPPAPSSQCCSLLCSMVQPWQMRPA